MQRVLLWVDPTWSPRPPCPLLKTGTPTTWTARASASGAASTWPASRATPASRASSCRPAPTPRWPTRTAWHPSTLRGRAPTGAARACLRWVGPLWACGVAFALSVCVDRPPSVSLRIPNPTPTTNPNQTKYQIPKNQIPNSGRSGSRSASPSSTRPTP